MANRRPQTNAELIQALTHAFDSITLDAADSHEELRSVGIDPEALRAAMGTFAREALNSSPLNWRVRAAEERKQAMAELRTYSLVHRPRPEIEAAIREIVARGNPEARSTARAFFHKFEGRASDADLASLLTQLQFMEAMLRGKN
jgi:hypothetical protein